MMSNSSKVGYSAFLLPKNHRLTLLELIPPTHDKIIAHHVTYQFGISREHFNMSSILDAIIKPYAVVDDGDSIQALAVTVDGESERTDGNYYHITWSLDPSKAKPVDSNKILKDKTLYTPLDGASTKSMVFNHEFTEF